MTIRQFFILASFLLPVTSFAAAAFARNSCRGVDLRRPELNRPQSQVFMDADGKETDSALCASFSSALLTSQQLGRSINPVDYAFQNILAMISKPGTRALGYCRQKAIDVYMGKEPKHFIQIFSDFMRQFNSTVKVTRFDEMSDSEKQKISHWLDDICDERIQRPPMEDTTIDLKPKDWSGGASSYPLMSAAEMGDEIDRLLDTGHFVSYTHAFHAVTIVGRTEDCRYIIQDSIPESAWNNDGGLKVSLSAPDSAPEDQAHITFENQFFQYWPRAILLKNVARIRYVEIRAR